MALIDNINRVNPDHIALGPGGESFFLARYPPSLANRAESGTGYEQMRYTPVRY